MRNRSTDPGSYRDPSGRVYFRDGRVYRTVMPRAADDFDFAAESGLIEKLEAEGVLVASKRVDPEVLGEAAAGARYVLEHPRLAYISYPYEWSFPAIKTAALLHLDIHLRALEHGVTLSDASAYNIQFIGPKPIFIDRLSFKRYIEGELWNGHRQFCEQFLNPLLLRSLFGIAHNAWYRGTQEGIDAASLSQLLSLRHKFSWRLLTQVVLPSSLQKKTTKELLATQAKSIKQHKLPLTSTVRMLSKLRQWIEQLEPADTGRTVWGEYAKSHSYTSEEVDKKRAFISHFIKEYRPSIVWDLGCNTGDYSAAALDAGAGHVIGYDIDQAALEIAFARAEEEKRAFLPLFFDAANPSPNQGWAEAERKGLKARATADAILALAFTHHVAIARNVPLPELLNWLISLAPHGVIEFVPKSDPMIQHMLRLREDIFDDYTEEHFLACVESLADIVQSQVVSSSGRRLVSYSRRNL